MKTQKHVSCEISAIIIDKIYAHIGLEIATSRTRMKH